MLKWLWDFFSDRQFNVRIGSEYSDLRSMSNGVPQGSILSPLLFSILQFDLPNLVDTHILQYADDISFFVMEKSMDLAIQKIQNSINILNDWFNNIGLKISRDKTKFMVFTRKRLTRPPKLSLSNNDIKFVTSTNFLGITLDGPHLTWDKHIKYLINSSQQKLNIMKSLASTKWGANRKLMTLFYQSYIKSKILYGVQAYSSASPSILSRLEVVQNCAIRIITGLRRSTPIETLQFESNIYPLSIVIKTYVVKYLFKIYSLPFNHIIHKLFREQINIIINLSWNTLAHKSPLLKRAIDICNNLNISSDFIRNNDYNHDRFIPPPWFSIEENISTFFIQSKKEDINNEQAIQTYNFIKHTNYATYSKIYTDGSKQDNGSVGCAVYVDEISSSFSWKLESHHSILTAELFAIYQATLFARKHLKNQNIVIFSDSLSALTVINNYSNNSLNFLVNLVVKLIYHSCHDGVDIVLQWIPSHRGIVGNNIADLIAKEACSYNTTTSLPLIYNDHMN